MRRKFSADHYAYGNTSPVLPPVVTSRRSSIIMCTTYRLTYTNCFMAYLFFQTAQLLPLTLNLTTLVSNTISLYMYLPPTQMLIIIHFFAMHHAPGTCYPTQSPHYLALTNLNDLCLTSCSLIFFFLLGAYLY